MNIEEIKKQSETRQVKMIFKDSINDQSTFFGGTAMKWMDEVAYITATRFCRKRVVTTSVDKIQFIRPIPHGSIIELEGKVGIVGNVKLEINVDIFVEQKYTKEREKAVEGIFSFAAIDDNNRPVNLIDDLDSIPESLKVN